jgi:hypothetical protein
MVRIAACGPALCERRRADVVDKIDASNDDVAKSAATWCAHRANARIKRDAN